MTPKELAALLHGREYGREITEFEAAQAKAAGLVVVFGYSDDNVELEGAIHDEVAAYDGTTLRMTPLGLLPAWSGDDDEISEEDAAFYFKRKAAGFQTIEVLWSPKGEDGEPFASWAFKTAIPHETFDVMEDGELFCRGIVFALADVKGEATGPSARFTGDMLSIGDLADADLALLRGKPHVMLSQGDGREVFVIGLSLEECRALSPLFLDRATVTIGSAA